MITKTSRTQNKTNKAYSFFPWHHHFFVVLFCFCHFFLVFQQKVNCIWSSWKKYDDDDDRVKSSQKQTKNFFLNVKCDWKNLGLFFRGKMKSKFTLTIQSVSHCCFCWKIFRCVRTERTENRLFLSVCFVRVFVILIKSSQF